MDKKLNNLLQNERKYLYDDFSALHKKQQKLYKEIIKEQNNLLNKYPDNERQANRLVAAINSYDDKVNQWVANTMRQEKIEKHINDVRFKLHLGIEKPSKAFEKMGYQENSARNMLEKRNELFYPPVFQGLLSKVNSFRETAFTPGEAKIPKAVDLNLSKKTLQARKDRLTAEFKVLYKEAAEWKTEIDGLKKQLLQSQKDIQNPDFRMDFINGLESYHSIDHITSPVIDTVESFHSGVLNYAAALIRLHKKDEQILETRKQINDKKDYVNGSKTLKALNYKHGQALGILETVDKDSYTPKVLKAIDYIRSQGTEVMRTVDVHRVLETEKNVRLNPQLQARGSFLDRTNTARELAKNLQKSRTSTDNQEKKRTSTSKQENERT